MDSFKKHILRKLLRRKCIGAKHTSNQYSFSGLRRHQLKEAKHALNELVNENLVLKKNTHYGIQISLNPEKLEEIIKFVSTP